MFGESITPSEFCYALQGYVELNNATPTLEEFKRIVALLNTVDLSLEDDDDYLDCPMAPGQFVVWLTGYTHITQAPVAEMWQSVSERVWNTINDHLSLVFTKVTPDRTLKTTPVDSESETEVIFPDGLTKQDIEQILKERTKRPVDPFRVTFDSEGTPHLFCTSKTIC